MDEDDDGQLAMSPSDLFVRKDESLPFFIDVSKGFNIMSLVESF